MTQSSRILWTRRIAAAACVLVIGPGAAAHDADWSRCAAVASALERLDCYDALARDAELTGSAFGARDGRERRPATAAAKSQLPALAPVNSLGQRTSTPPAAGAGTADDFGFEDRLTEATPDQITSRYDGAFTGWSGNTLFRLANGQVWKQSQSGRSTFHRDRPVVTIRRGTFGVYRLTVDGMNKSVRVTRVK